jgi:hypothetical protein
MPGPVAGGGGGVGCAGVEVVGGKSLINTLQIHCGPCRGRRPRIRPRLREVQGPEGGSMPLRMLRLCMATLECGVPAAAFAGLHRAVLSALCHHAFCRPFLTSTCLTIKTSWTTQTRTSRCQLAPAQTAAPEAPRAARTQGAAAAPLRLAVAAGPQAGALRPAHSRTKGSQAAARVLRWRPMQWRRLQQPWPTPQAASSCPWSTPWPPCRSACRSNWASSLGCRPPRRCCGTKQARGQGSQPCHPSARGPPPPPPPFLWLGRLRLAHRGQGATRCQTCKTSCCRRWQPAC